MKTLKSRLTDITSGWFVDCTVKNRASGGCNVVFSSIMPSSCLDKLIAFCKLYGYNYYIFTETGDDSSIIFAITR